MVTYFPVDLWTVELKWLLLTVQLRWVCLGGRGGYVDGVGVWSITLCMHACMHAYIIFLCMYTSEVRSLQNKIYGIHTLPAGSCSRLGQWWCFSVMFRPVPETHERGQVSSSLVGLFCCNAMKVCNEVSLCVYFRYKGLLYGDISAVCAFRRVPQLIALLQATVRKQLPTI